MSISISIVLVLLLNIRDWMKNIKKKSFAHKVANVAKC